jgi:hypothetical protein
MNPNLSAVTLVANQNPNLSAVTLVANQRCHIICHNIIKEDSRKGNIKDGDVITVENLAT